MRITIISTHKPARNLPEIAKSLLRPKPTVRDGNTPEILLALSNAKRVVAHDVHAAGSVRFLIHATHDLVHLARRRDVLCAIRVRARRRCGDRPGGGGWAGSLDDGDCQGAFGDGSRRTRRHDCDSGRSWRWQDCSKDRATD